MIAQWVKLLLHKHEGLTLVPQLLCKELDVVATHVTHVCNPVLEHRIERWGLLVASLARPVSSRFKERLHLRK